MWFPYLYVYANPYKNGIWDRIISKKYCEKLFPLLNVTLLKEFKDKISINQDIRPAQYSNAFSSAPHILKKIKIEDAGKLN